jgi:hypothetical protein
MGISLIVIGLIVSLSGYIFAILNMAKVGNDFDGALSRHWGAMAVIVIGAILVVAGFLMIGLDLIDKL